MEGRRLYAEVADKDGVVLLRLEGVVDENNPLRGLLAEERERPIVIHAGKVNRINSCGVRDWVRWISALEERKNSVFFVCAPAALVNQINLVRNFCGEGGALVSLLAPYFCESCSAEHVEPVDTAKIPENLTPPAVLCTSCGEALSFDDVPEAFFAFAREHRARPVPSDVSRAVNAFDKAHIFTKVTELKELSPRPRGPA